MVKQMVTSVNVVIVPLNEDTGAAIEAWLENNQSLASDNGAIIIFSPYKMDYDLITELDNTQRLKITAYMARDKWASLTDADQLRQFMFSLEDQYDGLSIDLDLAISVKAFGETDRDYRFAEAFINANASLEDILASLGIEDDEE